MPDASNRITADENAQRLGISDGVKTKQLHGLLKKVDKCLSLKSGDVELQKLRG
ncbi:MAG: hypothetical protein VB861_20370 [Planctomycetaceae bacterium]